MFFSAANFANSAKTLHELLCQINTQTSRRTAYLHALSAGDKVQEPVTPFRIDLCTQGFFVPSFAEAVGRRVIHGLSTGQDRSEEFNVQSLGVDHQLK